MATLLAVRGLEHTSAAFHRELVALATRLGLSADFLAAVISFETGGTFDPAIRNPSSGATGLIQFMPSTAKQLGTSTDALARMSAVDQLEFVERYYAPVANRIATLSDHYLAVFAPIGLGRGPDFVLYASPSSAYEQNKALDHAGDGTITVSDASAPVAGIVREAEKRPRLLVTGNGGAPMRAWPAVAAVALAYGLWRALS